MQMRVERQETVHHPRTRRMNPGGRRRRECHSCKHAPEHHVNLRGRWRIGGRLQDAPQVRVERSLHRLGIGFVHSHARKGSSPSVGAMHGRRAWRRHRVEHIEDVRRDFHIVRRAIHVFWRRGKETR